jgi:uncharacterized membrane protein YhaH (DUF805 family)
MNEYLAWGILFCFAVFVVIPAIGDATGEPENYLESFCDGMWTVIITVVACLCMAGAMISVSVVML